MTIEISDNPELQVRLVAQMGQGATAGNIETPNVPRQTDVASFKAMSAADSTGNIGSATALDAFGHSQPTAAMPGIHNAGHAQQVDKGLNNALPAQDVRRGDQVEEPTLGQAAAKVDADAYKQDKAAALMSRIGQMTQQLAAIDIQIGHLNAGRNGESGEDPSARLGQLSSERGMLMSMIGALQQQLSTLQAG